MRPIQALVFLQLLGLPMRVLSSQWRLTAPAMEDPVPVPGNTTVNYCKDPEDYIVDIEYIKLSPNPPEKGKNLTIEAAFTSPEIIDVGATIHVKVKWGYITFLSQDFDFCDSATSVDLACPVEGAQKILKEVEIPEMIPGGMYVVTAEAYTAEGEEITCLKGSIVF